MRLLLDANLSYRLVKKLATHVAQCLHVTRAGLAIPADDYVIWEWARKNNCVIITNDDDFYNLANTDGFPSKVVLLRMGNQSSTGVLETVILHLDDIQKLAGSDEYGLVELF